MFSLYKLWIRDLKAALTDSFGWWFGRTLKQNKQQHISTGSLLKHNCPHTHQTHMEWFKHDLKLFHSGLVLFAVYPVLQQTEHCLKTKQPWRGKQSAPQYKSNACKNDHKALLQLGTLLPSVSLSFSSFFFSVFSLCLCSVSFCPNICALLAEKF